MRCSSCSADNPEDKRFCRECGGALKARCPRCGAENEPGGKFCGDCAAPLTSPAPAGPSAGANRERPRGGINAAERVRVTAASDDAVPDGERKTVTALFADIKGSMELMEDLDPEEARAIVDPALKLMIDAAHRYDGYIVQSTGDGIFALFGAPVAHEDHPQRALYAALRMQEELKRYSDRIRSEGRLPIQVRVGVNNGEVVVRSIKTDDAHTEYTPIGHSISLAARMQALAPIGSIASTEQVRKLCEGYFIFKGLGPTKVKGVSEPVNVYEVTGLGPLRTRLQRSAGRGLTKFVGRAREMDALKHAAEQAKAGHGQIVAAMAEAGTGKSRLFFEFKAISQSGCMVLEAFSVSHGKASAFLPVIDLLWKYFEITSDDDERKRREKITGRVLALDRSFEDALPYLYALLGLSDANGPLEDTDAQTRKGRSLEAIKRILLRESLNQPLIVIFEDLHWVDDETQAFLNLLADSIGAARILMLVNYRPEYSDQWNSKAYYTQLRLDPLGRENADEMLTALLGDGKDIVPLKRLIVERTVGNPFFMEETVLVLFDEGALARNGAAVKLTRPLSQLKIPPTVQAILAARIDRLAPDEKELLQTLAVIGKELPLTLVREVAGAGGLERRLEHLQLAEFIYEQPATGDMEYTFKHALTQEVAYNSLLSERRKLIHHQTARAIEALYAERLEDRYGELAHHYGRAADNRKAAHYLSLAAGQALERSANDEALAHAEAGLKLLEALPDDRERAEMELDLRLSLGPALRSVKGLADEEAGAALSRACELCRRLGRIRSLPGALGALSVYHSMRGERQQALEYEQEALAIAHQLNDPVEEALILSRVGSTSWALGDLAGARESLEKALAMCATLPASRPTRIARMNALSFSCMPLWQLGFPEQASRRCGEALSFAQGSGLPGLLAVFLGTVARVAIECGRHGPAREQVERLAGLVAEHELVRISDLVPLLKGWLLVRENNPEKGIPLILEANAMFDASNVKAAARFGPAYWPRHISVQAGRRTDRPFWMKHRWRASGTESATTIQSFCASEESLLLRDGSDPTEAEACVRRAAERARQMSAKSFELRAVTSLARLLAKQDRRDEARAMLAEIYDWFTEGFDTADLKDAKALLDELSA